MEVHNDPQVTAVHDRATLGTIWEDVPQQVREVYVRGEEEQEKLRREPVDEEERERRRFYNVSVASPI